MFHQGILWQYFCWIGRWEKQLEPIAVSEFEVIHVTQNYIGC